MRSPIQYIRQFLSVRLSLWIVLFATIIFLGALGYVFSMARKTAHQETIKHVTQILDNNVLRLTTIIDKAETAAKMTQWLVMRHDEVPDSMFVYSASTLKSNPDFYNCSISFNPFFYPDYGQFFSAYSIRQGDSICTLQRGSDNYRYLDTDWYRQTKMEGKPYWTEPYLDPDTTGNTGTTVISYCMPVYNRRNKTIGVIASSLSLDWLGQTISATKPFTNSYIVLTGKDGTIYVHPDTAKILKQNIFTPSLEQPDTAGWRHTAARMPAQNQYQNQHAVIPTAVLRLHRGGQHRQEDLHLHIHHDCHGGAFRVEYPPVAPMRLPRSCCHALLQMLQCGPGNESHQLGYTHGIRRFGGIGTCHR